MNNKSVTEPMQVNAMDWETTPTKEEENLNTTLKPYIVTGRYRNEHEDFMFDVNIVATSESECKKVFKEYLLYFKIFDDTSYGYDGDTTKENAAVTEIREFDTTIFHGKDMEGWVPLHIEDLEKNTYGEWEDLQKLLIGRDKQLPRFRNPICRQWRHWETTNILSRFRDSRYQYQKGNNFMFKKWDRSIRSVIRRRKIYV